MFILELKSPKCDTFSEVKKSPNRLELEIILKNINDFFRSFYRIREIENDNK